MKLHLPKVLLTAVLAVMVMPTAWAADSTTITNSGWGNEIANDSYVIGDKSIDNISTSDGAPGENGLFLRSGNSISEATVNTLNVDSKLTIDGWYNTTTEGRSDFTNLTIGTLNISKAPTIIVEANNTVTINQISGSLNSLTNKGTLTLNGATTVSGTLTANSESTLTIAGNVVVSGEMKFGSSNSENAKLIVNEGFTLTAKKLISSWGVDATINGVMELGEGGLQFASGPAGAKDIFGGTGTIKTFVLGVGNTGTYMFQGGLRMEIGRSGIRQTTATTDAIETTVLKNVTIAVAETWTDTVTKNLSLADTATGTTFEVGAEKSATISGVLSDYTHDSTTEAGKLVKTGAGTLTLSGNNTYSGGTDINGGTLKLGNAAALGTGAVTVNNGGTLDMNGTADVTNAVTLNKGATLTNTGGGIGTNMKQLPNVTLGGDAKVTGTRNFAMIQSDYGQANLNLGGHTLTKEGTNTFTLCNTNVSAGTLKVQEGTLEILSKGGVGKTDLSAANVNVGQLSDSQRGTFKLNSVDVTVSNLAMNGGTVNLNDNALFVSGTTTATSGTITGSGSLNVLTSDGTEAAMSVSRKDADIALTNVTLSNTGIGAVEGTQGSIANALVELQQNSAFSIADVTMTKVEISAAEVSTPVLLQPVKATDVSLTKGTFVTAATLTTAGEGAKTESGSTSYAYSTDALSGIKLNNEALSGNTDPSANIVLNLGGMGYFAQNAMGICDISITLTGFRVDAVDIKGIYFAADSWLGQLLAAQDADAYVKDKDSILSIAQENSLTTGTAGNAGVSVGLERTDAGTVITITGLDMVPEPTTTTLSLLALTALAARRRRR